MKKANWLIALGVEAGAPLVRAYAWAKAGRPPRERRDPRSWRKVLIVGDNHIGDLLYRSGSLGPLKAGLPGCELHYLVAPGSCSIIELHPAITRLLPWLRSDSPLDLSDEHMAELRAFNYDALLSTNSVKYWPELLLGLRLGIPNRVGFTYKGFSGWVTHPMPLRYPQAFPFYFRGYVAALTGQAPTWDVRPVIHTSAQDEEEAAAIWARVAPPPGVPVVAAFVTSRQPPGGIWPAASFGETLRLLRARREVKIILCGAASDRDKLEGVDQRFSLGASIVAGELGIRALSRLLARCNLMFGPDSGPRHVANAAGIPVVFVRNTLADAVQTGVYASTEIDLCPSPGRNVSPQRLLESIRPEVAAGKLATILERPGCA